MKHEKPPPIVLPDPLFTIKGEAKPVEDDYVIPWSEFEIEVPPSDEEGDRKSERVSLADLYARPELLIPPPTIFEGLAYEGRHTLFAGREKLGKSEVLGLVCARAEGVAPIVYFSFEEATGDLVARMKRYGADPTRIEVVEHINDLADIRRHIDEVRPCLAVIDSLASLLKRQLRVTASENSDEWGTWVEHLTHISHDTGAALVTSHHSNRESGEYRGHSSMGAACDLLVEMHGKKSESKRRFDVIGRVRGVAIPKLIWTGFNYALGSDGDDVSIQADIRNVLHTSPRLSMNKLLSAVQRNRNNVARLANQMLADGDIIDLNDNPRNRSLVNADEGARFRQTDVAS